MSTTRTSRSPPSVAILVAAGALVVGALVVLVSVLVLQDRAGQPSSELAAVQQGCEEWVAGDAPTAGSAETCRSMVEWMDGQQARSGMGPGMMTGTPEQLRERCEAWMADPPRADGAVVPRADDWCRHMTGWMSGHPDRWAPDHMRDGWMSPAR